VNWQVVYTKKAEKDAKQEKQKSVLWKIYSIPSMIKLTWNKNFENSLKRYLKKHPEKELKIKEKLKLFTGEPFAPEF